jgi:hypothetical protein
MIRNTGRAQCARTPDPCNKVPVTKCFRGFRRISPHKTGIAVRQVHRKEVDLALNPSHAMLSPQLLEWHRQLEPGGTLLLES